MQQDYIDHLHASETLQALLGSHSKHETPLINWVTRPDKEGLPAMTLETISTVGQYAQGGRSNEEPTRIQHDIWANSYLEARKIAKALRDYIDPRADFADVEVGDTRFHRIFFDADRDLPVQDLQGGERIYHIAIDAEIWHYNIA